MRLQQYGLQPSVAQVCSLILLHHAWIVCGGLPFLRTIATRAHCVAPSRARRYLLFAADPYETIAFKVPALEVDRDPAKFFTHWDDARKLFTLQLHFRVARDAHGGAGSVAPRLHR